MKIITIIFAQYLFLLLFLNNAQAQEKPNIIFILTDDLGYGDIGVLFQNQRKADGKPAHSTPHLDVFSREGLTLTRHYVPAPVCAPSRASLLMGLHQGHADVRNNQFDKALPDNHNLATVLKEAGYTTALIGKYGLQGLEGNSLATWEAYPTKRGFDYFFGYVRHKDGHNHYPAHKVPERGPMELYYGEEEISSRLSGCYTTDLFTARAKKYIIDHKAESPTKPFFLYLAYDTPHAGLEVASMPYPEGAGVQGGLQWIGEDGNYINTAKGEVNQYIHPDYRNDNWPEVHQRFASMVRRIDNAVGDLMQLLKDLEIDGETMIVFTSDNGPHHESYGYGDYAPTFFESFANLDGTKRDTWEGGIRVPTFVRWPGKIKADTKNQTPSGFHDWLPTFAEAAGIPAPANTDGRSLLPILKGQSTAFDGKVYVEYQVNGETPAYQSFHETHIGQKRGEMQVVYLKGFKGVRYNILSHRDDFRIYDTQNDPGEITDLAATDQDFVRLQQDMKNTVLQWRRPNASAERPYDRVPVPAVAGKRNLKKGIHYSLYSIKSPWVPYINPQNQDSKKKGILPKIQVVNSTGQEEMTVVYEGFLKVEEEGEYIFDFQTNESFVMHIHEALLFDKDKVSGNEKSGTAKVNLAKGLHPVKIVYQNKNQADPKFEIRWSGKNFQHADLEVFH
ncbi:sulfatase-like hydrolase/transferase [Aquiflexum sp.]|uniref:sulfatase-like hydrolase/transferase n=1 Tax=Aquiflexum sp. TaxID=1872584 RepID=UPI00359412FE